MLLVFLPLCAGQREPPCGTHGPYIPTSSCLKIVLAEVQCLKITVLTLCNNRIYCHINKTITAAVRNMLIRNTAIFAKDVD